MEAKFQKIANFIETLASEEVINENEEALLLVGGTGGVKITNNGCVNNGCSSSSDRIDHGCTNNGCTNTTC